MEFMFSTGMLASFAWLFRSFRGYSRDADFLSVFVGGQREATYRYWAFWVAMERAERELLVGFVLEHSLPGEIEDGFVTRGVSLLLWGTVVAIPEVVPYWEHLG